MPDDLVTRLREVAHNTQRGGREDSFSPEQVARGLIAAGTAALRALDPGPVPDYGLRGTVRAAMLDAFLAALGETEKEGT